MVIFIFKQEFSNWHFSDSVATFQEKIYKVKNVENKGRIIHISFLEVADSIWPPWPKAVFFLPCLRFVWPQTLQSLSTLSLAHSPVELWSLWTRKVSTWRFLPTLLHLLPVPALSHRENAVALELYQEIWQQFQGKSLKQEKWGMITAQTQKYGKLYYDKQIAISLKYGRKEANLVITSSVDLSWLMSLVLLAATLSPASDLCCFIIACTLLDNNHLYYSFHAHTLYHVAPYCIDPLPS